jgi:hypothetical protein
MSHWSFSASWSTWLGAILLWGFSAYICRANYLRSGRRPAVLRLEALRFLLITLLAFTLFRPEWVQVSRKNVRPEVAVLFDGSRSMETRDIAATNGANAITRADWVTNEIKQRFWKPIESNAKVSVVEFSGRPTNNAASPKEGTDLNSALDQLLQSQENLKAVLLLTDGDWNLGKNPVSAATRYREQHVPIFSVAVGRETPLPDLQLDSVSPPSYGLFGEQITIPFTIRSHLDREVKTTVTLVSGDRVETKKQITIPPHADHHDSILFSPRVAGTANLTLKLPVEPDESLKDNNESAFPINVRMETLKVLVVDSTPRWEFRFLRNALMRDPGVECNTVLLHPGMSPGGGKNYLPAFPGTKELLSRYDVIFLGEVGIGPNELTIADAELIKGLVEQQGSGLVLIPGRRGRESTFLESPLKDLIPVVFDTSKPEGIGLQNEGVVTLSTVGRRHLLTRFDADESRNDEIWKQLPGFFWSAAVERSRPGSEVLAVHSALRNAYGRMPVLVTRNAGSGKVLFMGTDSAWRWRRGVEDRYHYRFWSQVVRWMAHNRHLSQKEGIRLTFSPEAPQIGDTVYLQSTVLDAAGFPLEDGLVTATVAAPSGRTEQIQFTPVEGGWGVFKSSFMIQEGGAYKITVRSEKSARTLQTELPVAETIHERTGQPINRQILAEIANLTGGTNVPPESLNALVQQISVLPEPEPLERRLRLWSNPWWGGLILFLLTTYWIGRKAAGLI